MIGVAAVMFIVVCAAVVMFIAAFIAVTVSIAHVVYWEALLIHYKKGDLKNRIERAKIQLVSFERTYF